LLFLLLHCTKEPETKHARKERGEEFKQRENKKGLLVSCAAALEYLLPHYTEE